MQNHETVRDQSLRRDPRMRRALEVIGTGAIGQPRTVSLEWSFVTDRSLEAAADLVDVAAALLDGAVVALYATACAVGEPPLITINVLVDNGGIATIEAAGDGQDTPPRHHLHIIGTDGELTRRFAQDNLLWGDGAGSVVTPDDVTTGQADEQPSDHADGGDPQPDTIAAALVTSLATGEMVRLDGGDEGGAR